MTYLPTLAQSSTALECPKCGKHSIVQYQGTRYICLSCNWEKDVSEKASVLSKRTSPLSFPVLMFTGLMLVLILR